MGYPNYLCFRARDRGGKSGEIWMRRKVVFASNLFALVRSQGRCARYLIIRWYYPLLCIIEFKLNEALSLTSLRWIIRFRLLNRNWPPLEGIAQVGAAGKTARIGGMQVCYRR